MKGEIHTTLKKEIIMDFDSPIRHSSGHKEIVVLKARLQKRVLYKSSLYIIRTNLGCVAWSNDEEMSMSPPIPSFSYSNFQL